MSACLYKLFGFGHNLVEDHDSMRRALNDLELDVAARQS